MFGGQFACAIPWLELGGGGISGQKCTFVYASNMALTVVQDCEVAGRQVLTESVAYLTRLSLWAETKIAWFSVPVAMGVGRPL